MTLSPTLICASELMNRMRQISPCREPVTRPTSREPWTSAATLNCGSVKRTTLEFPSLTSAIFQRRPGGVDDGHSLTDTVFLAPIDDHRRTPPGRIGRSRWPSRMNRPGFTKCQQPFQPHVFGDEFIQADQPRLEHVDFSPQTLIFIESTMIKGSFGFVERERYYLDGDVQSPTSVNFSGVNTSERKKNTRKGTTRTEMGIKFFGVLLNTHIFGE